MSDYAERKFSGDGKRRYTPIKGAHLKPEPYWAPPKLRDAVNVALYLRRPLLLEGDPGCGKTQLAYAVAYELGYPLKTAYIRSTDRAKDLLYTYDAVRRLYDIQEYRTNASQETLPPRAKYVTPGSLGEAIDLACGDTPSVVLIDEIDKADIDFPNDLLLELDRYRYEIVELREDNLPDNGHIRDALKGLSIEERRDHLPLVIVTSNREKELPKPFLRRCLYFFIKFPNKNEMQKIVSTHFKPGLTPLFDKAMQKFWDLRESTEINWRKPPGTSELLNWLTILEFDEAKKVLTPEKLEQRSLRDLPHLYVLVKTQSDLEAISQLDE